MSAAIVKYDPRATGRTIDRGYEGPGPYAIRHNIGGAVWYSEALLVTRAEYDAERATAGVESVTLAL